MAEPTVKICRVLVYEGSADWVRKTFKRNAVKRIHEQPDGNRITEVAIHGLDQESRLFLFEEGLPS